MADLMVQYLLLGIFLIAVFALCNRAITKEQKRADRLELENKLLLEQMTNDVLEASNEVNSALEHLRRVHGKG